LFHRQKAILDLLLSENNEENLKAAICLSVRAATDPFLQIADVPRPELRARHVLLRVAACGVCRTDLHIVEGDLPPIQLNLIPGHQIVGEVVEDATAELPIGSRVGACWLGGVDGDCWFCQHGMENLCNEPTFTGYTVNGGYAEYARANGFRFSLACWFGR
jgi:propanol-preferring alcohol dehydrogenase